MSSSRKFSGMIVLLVIFCLVSNNESIEQKEMVEVDRIKGLEAFQHHTSSKLNKRVYATCSIILFDEIVDYATATANCRKLEIFEPQKKELIRGNLATVNNINKTEDIKLLLGMAYKRRSAKEAKRKDFDQWVWVGLRKLKNNKGNKKSKKYDATHWKWPDGTTPENYSVWQASQPDQKKRKKEKQNQIRINHDGEWQDIWKNKEHPYACDYRGKYIISTRPMSWKQARKSCVKAGMILAKVRNDKEIEEMKRAMFYFLGPGTKDNDVGDEMNWILVGGNDIGKKSRWQWTDGEDIENVDKFPWISKMMPLHKTWGNKRHHVMTFSRNGTFDDTVVSETRRRFACQCIETLFEETDEL